MGSGHNSMSKAAFIGGDLFWQTLVNFRIVWIRGRFGGGKTSLAAIICARLLAESRVNQVVSNIPMTFSVPAVAPLKQSAILLDESWIYIEGRKDVSDYAAFVRKQEHYLILPSVFPVHNRLSFFYVQRVFNAYIVGLPLWWYRWTLRDKDVKETGTFGILHPTAIFNHYPTSYVPGTDAGIGEAINDTVRKDGYKGTRTEQKIFGIAEIYNAASASSNIAQDFGSQDEIAALDDIAQQFDASAEDIEKIVSQIKRRL